MPRLLREILNHDLHTLRKEMKETLNHPVFQPRYHLNLEQERELAYQRLGLFLSKKHINVFDFNKNPRRIFAAHEVLGLCDGSMTTKFTVQMNLFGGTLLRFGQHPSFQPVLENISHFKDVGCFGLTELGYGNNAVEMETTATFDTETDEFIIHSPSSLSQKYWITNGYCHAHWCIVFAQLISQGEHHGVHGFLVRIRDNNLNCVNGVTVQDMGYKIGLNGVDNARLWFDHVRVPRHALLDAFSQVDKQGHFTSSIKSKRARFIKMADQLLSGRLCIAAMTLSSAKSSIFNAIKYSQTRCGVGNDGTSSAALLTYQFQQLALIPLLAKTIALNIGLNKIKDQYAETQVGSTVTQTTPSSLIKTCCVIKPIIAWHAENVASVCRERCGGQGYLACNRFGEALASAHAAITAEGDNGVLMQKVAKELLTDVKPIDLVMHILKKCLPQRLISVLNYRSPEKLLAQRAKWLLNELAIKMHFAKSRGKKSLFETWMHQEALLVQDAAMAYGKEIIAKELLEVEQKENHPLLAKIKELDGLAAIDEDMAWYSQQGLVSKRHAKKIKSAIARLCRHLAAESESILDGFDIPSHLQYAPIVKDWQQFNEKGNDNQGEIIKNFSPTASPDVQHINQETVA